MENTSLNSDFMDLPPGAPSFHLLWGGPVIAIEVEPENIASLISVQNQMDIVRDVSTRLDAADIGYMLTGSMALNCHALPAVPRNLDFVIELHPVDAPVLVRLFGTDYELSREELDNAIAQQTSFNLLHRESRIRVNGIICQQAKYRLTEFSRRQRITFENFRTWVVSKEDLIISKLHWIRKSNSQRHLRDVINLAATGCDAAYIERWTRALGVLQSWQECLEKTELAAGSSR